MEIPVFGVSDAVTTALIDMCSDSLMASVIQERSFPQPICQAWSCNEHAARDEQLLAKRGDFAVYVCDNHSPPRILIGQRWLALPAEEQRALVLAHELSHSKLSASDSVANFSNIPLKFPPALSPLVTWHLHKILKALIEVWVECECGASPQLFRTWMDKLIEAVNVYRRERNELLPSRLSGDALPLLLAITTQRCTLLGILRRAERLLPEVIQSFEKEARSLAVLRQQMCATLVAHKGRQILIQKLEAAEDLEEYNRWASFFLKEFANVQLFFTAQLGA